MNGSAVVEIGGGMRMRSMWSQRCPLPSPNALAQHILSCRHHSLPPPLHRPPARPLLPFLLLSLAFRCPPHLSSLSCTPLLTTTSPCTHKYEPSGPPMLPFGSCPLPLPLHNHLLNHPRSSPRPQCKSVRNSTWRPSYTQTVPTKSRSLFLP